MPATHLTLADLHNMLQRHPRGKILRIDIPKGEIVFWEGSHRWVWAVGTFAGERSASCFEVTDLTDRDGNWTARDWSWDEQAQDQQEAVGF